MNTEYESKINPSAQASILIDSTHNAPSVPADLTVLIPCFNEESSIDQLADRFTEMQRQYPSAKDWELIFIDDGSKDGTAQRIEQAFRDWPRFSLLRHSANQGLTAALKTGWDAARTRWVVCIDADCTYDPEIIPRLLAHAESGFDVVTASPYHAHGAVIDVAKWRIALSRLASWMYGRLFQSKLTCYTACVRIYDSQWLKKTKPLRFPGFVGITELLWRLDELGARISEVPAILRPRTTGTSKMRVLRTTQLHLRLMAAILVAKFFRN